MTPPPPDRFGRHLEELRVSVTDRCNLRCVYCMPKEVFGRGYPYLSRDRLLTFEEISRLARIFADLGVRKIRLTGGEPLLRREIPRLVSMLATIDGIDLALTTNGMLLADLAGPLASAGLGRVTVSLDALDNRTFSAITDVGAPVRSVLEGIEAASAAGLSPVKINMVVKRGLNEQAVMPVVRQFRGSGHVVRFIEYMDAGRSNGWRPQDVVTGSELLDTIRRELPLEALPPIARGETARRWRIADGSGEIGFITAVSDPFCRDCTRARLTADGKLFTCLFGASGTDLSEMLRRGDSDRVISDAITRRWSAREDRYSELRSWRRADDDRVEMSYLGG
jgi:cyclic pyranopterin phosphate synthase